ncbi:hypothetical protein P256_01923 [Acinetobacter nectaris CIP 110549]|uniref:Uroporphyrinogen-III synthase n=1 Tax=Acinetobacter nectaris CIP 110549 TaxID=1392540 RepID=V2USS3_9GAMM|nr:uroporphyrinogen-III synthase [Acinetobacter nectaris]ESK38384.1 hypothetical protein P256_01923 [Acinetobacter nectaris CIP 110549]MCF9045780.1 uroporphyrinogen-III synthase [Acinetobacter nectaris]
MLFINTRPRDRADALTREICKQGIDVLDVPLLHLESVALSEQLTQQFHALPQANIIIVVSPTAAKIGLSYLAQVFQETPQLESIHWIAVGAKTAEVLKAAGINAHIPKVETSEGMLELPILKQASIQSIAFWRGEGGRQFMMSHLAQKNINIINMILYKRSLPRETVTSFQHVAEILKQYHQKIYVCISSEASWLNWLNLLKHDLDVVSKCHYIVLGARLHSIVAKNIPLEKILLASNLKANELGSLMQQ